MKHGSVIIGVIVAFALVCSSALAVPTVRIEGPSATLTAGGGTFNVNIYISGFDKGPLVVENGVPVGYEWNNTLAGFVADFSFTGGRAASFVLGQDPGGFGFDENSFETYALGRTVALGPLVAEGAYRLVGELDENYFGTMWLSSDLEVTDELLLATATFEYDASAAGTYEIGLVSGDTTAFVRSNEDTPYIEYQVVGGTVSVAPEPATLLVLGGGLLGLIAYRRRK